MNEELPWDETNPEWWKFQIEGMREGDVLYQWLVNEWAARDTETEDSTS